MSELVTYETFAKVDFRVGTIVKIEDFPEARKPAYKLTVDFGNLGYRKTSAQITVKYSKADLLHKQVVAVVNFPKKQIANFMSSCLVLGAVDKTKVYLLAPELKIPNGTRVN